jgi:hypothetical protein
MSYDNPEGIVEEIAEARRGMEGRRVPRALRWGR